MNIENILILAVQQTFEQLFQQKVDSKQIQIQKTRKDFEGDITLVCFPLARYSKKSPEATAEIIGKHLVENCDEVDNFNVVKGFLNLNIATSFWFKKFKEIAKTTDFGIVSPKPSSPKIMIEYSSPNTNKPLHLGHIRNNLLGSSVSKILKAAGNNVIQVNLVNDRGIHICKSMLAWMKYGEGITPQKANIKGDKLVGDFYVRFDKEYKKQISDLINKGLTEDIAKKEAPIIIEAQEILKKWEQDDKEIRDIWQMMNSWVYDGFAVTYKNLGIEFDKIYYESQTYKLGKTLVTQGIKDGVLFNKEDGSVWANLQDAGLDEKLLLRADGTSVYMTQDLGTAHQRFEEFDLDKSLYVVGNEQNYHFQVLKLVLKKLGNKWSDKMQHLSYGMVELPSGKMKSREGTVVDADDLIEEMIATAKNMSEELGKLEGLTEKQASQVFGSVALGALKYFILKVDPKKNMMFNPQESIDFNGNTGPFIQYTYARIKSILRKAKEQNIDVCLDNLEFVEINDKEKHLIQLLSEFPTIVQEAAQDYSPALIANYVYDLVKEYNQFYHDYSILKEPDNQIKKIRITLSQIIALIINNSLIMLGIEAPERM